MDEPGRSVAGDGRVVYDWPPAGRFAELWARVGAVTSDDEKFELYDLLGRWVEESSTLVAFTDEAGGWVDVDWDEPAGWSG